MSEADDIREFMGLVGKDRVGKGRSKGPLQELIKALSPREYRRYLHIVEVDKQNRKGLGPHRRFKRQVVALLMHAARRDATIGNKGPSK